MIKITKGGRLEKTVWHYDEEKDEGSYVTKDVTDSAISHMWDYCELADDLVLQDIFLLLNTELDIFDAMIGNWCKEIVTEGLKTPKVPDLIEGMEFLELYWHYDLGKKWVNDVETDEYQIIGNNFPDFHGYGTWSMDEGVEEPMEGGFGVSFTPANELALYPIRLNKTLVIDCDDESKRSIDFPNPSFTLGHIFIGIIWELSFHGSPGNRKKTSDKIKSAISKIKGSTDESDLD